MAKEQETKAVARKETTEVALPAYMKNATIGGSHLDTEDMVIPRLKIIQKLDPVFETDPMLGGCFYNNLTGESYGKSIQVVVLIACPGVILFGKKGSPDAGKVLAKKFKDNVFPPLNPEKITDDMLLWREGEDGDADQKPEATKVFTYIVIVNGKDLLQFSVMGASYKVGKKFNTMLGRGALHTKQFELTSIWIDKGPQTKYYSFEARPAGLPDEKVFSNAENLLSSFSGKSIKHEVESEKTQDDGDKPF